MKKILINIMPKFVRKAIHSAIMAEVKEQTDPDSIAVNVVRGVGFVINKGTSSLSDEKMVSICEGFELGGDTLKEVAKGCNPQSENGRKFSEAEEAAIKSNLIVAIEKILPKEAVESINNEISNRIATYLGI